MESMGCADYSVIEEILPYLDQYLLDIKHMNSKKHEEFTGRGNELMLENAKKIAASGMTELSIRIPVIPGFNDTPEEIRDIAVFTRELGHVKRLHLLPYHRLGQDKYVGLNRPYLMGEVKPPANEKMQMLLKVAEEFSVRISENEVLCTPTGVSKGFMTPDYICKVDLDGNVLQANKGFRPSSEIKMHLRVYKERPDVKSVVHAHPLYATTFAIAGIPLTQPIMPEAVIALGCVPIAKYGTPSTVEIPDAVSEHLQYFDAVLLENHGALTYSDSLLNAYHKMESVEFYARLLWQTMQIGGPQELNKEQVEKLYEIRRQMGLSGKHPANLCPNAKAGKPSCHSCGGGCGAAKTAETPDADLVASITKKVMDQLGLN